MVKSIGNIFSIVKSNYTKINAVIDILKSKNLITEDELKDYCDKNHEENTNKLNKMIMDENDKK